MAGDNEFNVKERKKERVAVLGVFSVMLLAMVVAVTVGIKGTGHTDTSYEEEEDDDGLATSSKAVRSICQMVEYQRACERTLAHAHTTNPKKLVQTTFNAAMEKLEGALTNSSTIKAAKDDRRNAGALETCKQVVEYAITDLKRSIDQMDHFDMHKKEEHVENMRIWLSGAMTSQETCIEAFQNTTGDAGEKMKLFLNASRELTSNGLDVATELSTGFKSLNISHQNHKHKRMLLEEQGEAKNKEEIPHWVDTKQQKLLHARGPNVKADVVVAKDGSGNFKTITEALKQAPIIDATKVEKGTNKTFVIYIKEGVYEDEVQVEANMWFVMLIGDGPTKTKITGKKNFADGFVLFKTATVSIFGHNFIARDIGFENSAGAEKHQAIALLVQSDKSVFYNCHINGYQDTLYAHSYRQFYRHCTVSGTIDFIFGNAAAVFQNCKLVIRKPLEDEGCVITAQARQHVREPTGFVLQNCTIMTDPLYYPLRLKSKAFLGHPWKKFSRTIIMQSFLPDSIAPEGWKPWMGTFGQSSCFFSEYENRGPGAALLGRVKWHGIKKITPQQADGFTPSKFYQGNHWIIPTGVPYEPGMMHT